MDRSLPLSERLRVNYQDAAPSHRLHCVINDTGDDLNAVGCTRLLKLRLLESS